MNLIYLFNQSIFLFFLFASVAFISPVRSQEPGEEGAGASTTDTQAADETSEESSDDYKKYTYGGVDYYSPTPVEREFHFKEVVKSLSSNIKRLFGYSWRARCELEKLRNLSSLDRDFEKIRERIIREYHDFNRLSKVYYEEAQRNVLEYVEPAHLPKDLCWRFGVFLGLYGNCIQETARWNPYQPLVKHTLTPAENAKVLACYHISLLYFSYSFGLSEKCPSIIQRAALDDIVSDPDFIRQLDIDVQNEFYSLDEAAWIEAMHSLDQQQLEQLCVLFRSMSNHFLQNKESLPKLHFDLAAHLCSLTTKQMLSVQKNPVYNLDAVNPWYFKLYIDLRKWQVLQMQDKTLPGPDLETLLPEVQKLCSKLLPQGFSLDDVTEENEYAICHEVRMRNLLPTNRGDKKKGEEIFDEFEFSPAQTRQALMGLLHFIDVRARYLRGYEVTINKDGDMTQRIYNYLSGYIELSDIPITKENALEYLFLIKLFDLMTEVWNSNYHVEYSYAGFHFGYIGSGQFYFPNTTFELRKKILKLCPTLKSYEALTVSTHPQKVKDEKDYETSGAWVDESETLRQKCIDGLLESALHLSNLMGQSPLQGIIVGARGISGAGKSTYLKRAILPLIIPEDQRESLPIDALVKGILNPDTVKASLKKLQGDTLNTQVHHEGYHAFRHLLRELSAKGNYILDKRHLTPHEIVTDLVEPAKKSCSSVWLFDFDISLTSSLTRILARPLHGESPCPEYEALIDGFRCVRRYRAQVLALAIKESFIAKYELYATSKQRMIVHKTNDEPCPLCTSRTETLCIHDLNLYDECLKEPDNQTIEEEVSQVIDDSFIAQAIIQGDISFEQREMLEKWRGLTLKESIQRHVQGNKEGSDEALFEQGAISSFNGTEWLAEFRNLIEFLHCEHLLHVHGVDETGRGLHWEAEQNENGLNPKYNPDAKIPGCKQGGIQMRVGYFIVPLDKLDIYLSENLSPTVTRELVVRDDEGELIGVRFFVHPEAYPHFAPLFQAGIVFVPPSRSAYMGTPLSSYNSWLLRRVSSSDRKPFIVKMGTPNGSGDIKHLFAGDDIVRSLSLQKKLDEMPDKHSFMLFNETVGLILENIPGYPEGTVDSGIVISEVPEQLLTGDCKLLSLSAALSCERVKPENRGLGALDHTQPKLPQLPLIFELMDAAIQKGLVLSSKEFIKTYFIDAYLQAIESLVFKHGYSLGGRSDNLYLVLNSDNTIKGFAYRDLEGIVLERNFLESYAWSYRYANLIKLLNVLTQSESDESLPSLGAPIRAGTEKPASERNLYCALSHMLEQEGDDFSLEKLKKLSITPNQNLKLLEQLDSSYLNLLKSYFEFDEALLLNPDGTVPCAEKGSNAEKGILLKNRLLWEGRKKTADP